MKQVAFTTEQEFANFFNFTIQPRNIRVVNGVAVNVSIGALCANELEVTKRHVTITTYFPEKQDTSRHFFKAPFIVEY